MLNTIILEKIGSMEDQEILEALNEIKVLKNISFEETQTLYQIVSPYLLSENFEVVKNTEEVIAYLLVLQPNLEIEAKNKKGFQKSASEIDVKLSIDKENLNHNLKPDLSKSHTPNQIIGPIPIESSIESKPETRKNVTVYTIVALGSAFFFFSGLTETNNNVLTSPPKGKLNSAQIIEVQAASKNATNTVITVQNSEPESFAPSPISPVALEIGWDKFKIVDKDGYTNIRSKPTKAAQVIGKVLDGEVVQAQVQSGNWYPVKTENNQKGFIHKSRLHKLFSSHSQANETQPPEKTATLSKPVDSDQFSSENYNNSLIHSLPENQSLLTVENDAVAKDKEELNKKFRLDPQEGILYPGFDSLQAIYLISKSELSEKKKNSHIEYLKNTNNMVQEIAAIIKTRSSISNQKSTQILNFLVDFSDRWHAGEFIGQLMNICFPQNHFSNASDMEKFLEEFEQNSKAPNLQGLERAAFSEIFKVFTALGEAQEFNIIPLGGDLKRVQRATEQCYQEVVKLADTSIVTKVLLRTLN